MTESSPTEVEPTWLDRNKLVPMLTALVLGLAADQASKIWIRANLEERADRLDLIPGLLQFVHSENFGAVNGLFGNLSYRVPLLIAFTVVAGGVLLDMYRKLEPTDRLLAAALGMTLSGAIGNAIDRLHHGSVTDFIRVYSESGPLEGALRAVWGASEWPTFNIADVSLVVGVALIIVLPMFKKKAGEDQT